MKKNNTNTTEFTHIAAMIVSADYVNEARAANMATGRGQGFSVPLSMDGMSISHYGASGSLTSAQAEWCLSPLPTILSSDGSLIDISDGLRSALYFSVTERSADASSQFYELCDELGLTRFDLE